MKNLLFLFLALSPFYTSGQHGVSENFKKVNTKILYTDSITITDASGADSILLFDDGDTARWSSDNPIKIGANSIIIKTDGDLIVEKNIYYDVPHVFMSFSDSAVVPAMTQNNWVQITNAGDSLYGVELADDFTINADTIIVGIKGQYSVIASISYIGGGGNEDHEFRIMLNGTQKLKMHRSTTNASSNGALTLPISITTEVGDEIWLEVRNTSDNDDISLTSGSITMMTIHLIQ